MSLGLPGRAGPRAPQCHPGKGLAGPGLDTETWQQRDKRTQTASRFLSAPPSAAARVCRCGEASGVCGGRAVRGEGGTHPELPRPCRTRRSPAPAEERVPISAFPPYEPRPRSSSAWSGSRERRRPRSAQMERAGGVCGGCVFKYSPKSCDTLENRARHQPMADCPLHWLSAPPLLPETHRTNIPVLRTAARETWALAGGVFSSFCPSLTQTLQHRCSLATRHVRSPQVPAIPISLCPVVALASFFQYLTFPLGVATATVQPAERPAGRSRRCLRIGIGLGVRDRVRIRG